jgi:hypothetical protein
MASDGARALLSYTDVAAGGATQVKVLELTR